MHPQGIETYLHFFKKNLFYRIGSWFNNRLHLAFSILFMWTRSGQNFRSFITLKLFLIRREIVSNIVYFLFIFLIFRLCFSHKCLKLYNCKIELINKSVIFSFKHIFNYYSIIILYLNTFWTSYSRLKGVKLLGYSNTCFLHNE